MGKKINPKSFRLSINKDWRSKWFSTKKNYSNFLHEDVEISDYITKKLKSAAIEKVNIQRGEGTMKIKIAAGRPGIIIGRGGAGIEELKKNLISMLMSIRAKSKQRAENYGYLKNGKINKTNIEIDVEEVKNFEENATLVSRSVADQLEKRMSFRRVLKSTLDSVIKQRTVKGAKIMVSGRLNGAEMSRKEWVIKGGIPLHTLRAAIDYGRSNAYTTYGVIGVKVWIYKGEVFRRKR